MSQGPSDLDKVFKALGNETRRRILRLLAQGERYPYELSKVLGLTPRGVFKHLEALQEAGLVERQHGESEVGPDRVYYRLNVRFGLSTTILPDAFVVRLRSHGRSGRRLIVPQGFIIPEARPDVAAVRKLLRELGKVNRKLESLDDERMRFASLRSQIIRQIEAIMEHAEWDEESCQKVRTLIDPIRQQVDESIEAREDAWASTVQEALKLFESMFTGRPPSTKKRESDEDVEIILDPE
ncbi:MAG: helix-turn-helix domain-containing protein [Candidatus Thorarchaeota archaeon]|jgi:predicted transcriptional regulator